MTYRLISYYNSSCKGKLKFEPQHWIIITIIYYELCQWDTHKINLYCWIILKGTTVTIWTSVFKPKYLRSIFFCTLNLQFAGTAIRVGSGYAYFLYDIYDMIVSVNCNFIHTKTEIQLMEFVSILSSYFFSCKVISNIWYDIKVCTAKSCTLLNLLSR